jgi:hypothetical protein
MPSLPLHRSSRTRTSSTLVRTGPSVVTPLRHRRACGATAPRRRCWRRG